MNSESKNELINKVASLLHKKNSEAVLKEFHSRYLKMAETVADPMKALVQACFVGNNKQSEVYVDSDWAEINGHNARYELRYFDKFKELVEDKIIEIQSYAKRNLTLAERFRASSEDYREDTKEENILRPFNKLSADSKKEYLQLAITAVNIYEEYAKRGAVLAQYAGKKATEAVGTLLHAAWMKTTEKTAENANLFVPYDKLDNATKNQELEVFRMLVKEVEADEQKYAVNQVEDLEPINPKQVENAVLTTKNPDMVLKNER